MAFELRENNVMIFANLDKKSLLAPVLTGKVNVQGVEQKLAGWKAKKGEGITGRLSVKSGSSYSCTGGFEFKSVKEKTNKLSPDKIGTLTVGEKVYKLALWEKISKSGSKFLSGTIQDEDKAVPIVSHKKEENKGATPLPTSGGSDDVF